LQAKGLIGRISATVLVIFWQFDENNPISPCLISPRGFPLGDPGAEKINAAITSDRSGARRFETNEAVCLAGVV
jgi:hypothetical protein